MFTGTVRDLRRAIKYLPDDTPVVVYDGEGEPIRLGVARVVTACDFFDSPRWNHVGVRPGEIVLECG
jgi:hypothetical protein